MDKTNIIRKIVEEEKKNIRTNMLKNYKKLLTKQINNIELSKSKQKEEKLKFEWTEYKINPTKQIRELGFDELETEEMTKTINSILNEFNMNLVNEINKCLTAS